MQTVYQLVHVNAQLGTMGQHAANVNRSKRIFEKVIFNFIISKDKGCISGGVFTCLNGGKCLSTGFCECKQGFLGVTCAEREY